MLITPELKRGLLVRMINLAGNQFGLVPQIGVIFNNLRLSGIYHPVTGKDLLTVLMGDFKEISRNYLVIELGFKIFGSNK